jgi:hypothetical protein
MVSVGTRANGPHSLVTSQETLKSRKHNLRTSADDCISDIQEALYENQIMTLRELAERLRVSVSGLRKILKREPDFPRFPVGQQLRFDWSQVVAYLSKGES